MFDYNHKISAVEIFTITENKEKIALFEAIYTSERQEAKIRFRSGTDG